jgi:pimeloyl-ACP methyl ester carboxylesterase
MQFLGEKMPLSGDIYYFDSHPKGNGNLPVIVLIHGAGGHHLHWPRTIRRLPGFRVLAPDLPGHGKSGGLGEQSIAPYAQKITHWLDTIGVGRATFVGHSMGGAIVQTLALDHPDYLISAVLIGTGAELPVNQKLLEMVAHSKNVDFALDLILKWSYSKNADPKLIEQVRKKMKEIRPTVLNGDFIACNAFNVSERLSEIKLPVQIIVGEEDKMTPLPLSQKLQALIKNSKLDIIPGAGHMLMLEKEGEVAKVIESFLHSKFK